MLPFLVLVARPPGKIAVDENDAIIRYGQLEPNQLERLDLDQSLSSLPNLSKYSGVFITGSPYNYLTESKSDSQKRTEENVLAISEQVLAHDFPTLGLCYGLQMLGLARGGSLTRDYPEDMGPHTIELSHAGKADELTGKLPESFYSYAAHAEALASVPTGMQVLGSSAATPVHIGKFGENIYGTQHHPEIGRNGIGLRINHYVGVYFSEEEYPHLLQKCQAVRVEHGLITQFARKYRS